MSLKTLLAELNESQRLAATVRDRHVLVLAGAGCGKTKTIIARAAFLIDEGVPANRIQILTFTRRSASEIVERVRTHLGDQATGLRASTFHAWCISLMRHAPALFGCRDHSVIDREDQLQLFKMLRSDKKKSSLPTAAELCDLYSYARNTIQSLESCLAKNAKDSIAQLPEIAAVMRRYEARKFERRYLDYDDILDIVAQSLSEVPQCRDWVTSHFDQILVDEMQDTNPLQWKLLEPLIVDCNLFCVGDDAQSIYGFRGADFRNVHSFSERVSGAKTLRLEQNYRSHQEILDASNWLLSNSPLNYDKNLIAVRGISGQKPQLWTFSDEFSEGRWIADDLQSRNASGAKWNQHMILMRSGYSGRATESALLAREIPYRFIGGTKLLESAHIRDALSLLRIVGNFRDEIAWMRYLQLWPGIGEVKSSNLVHPIMSLDSINQSFELLDSEFGKSNDACKILRSVSNCSGNVSQAFDAAMNGVEPLLSELYKKRDWDKRKRDFPLVRKLTEKHDSILAFIEDYLLDPVYVSDVERNELSDVVTLITIHSAKGTESDICYVVNVSPGAYPQNRDIGNADDVEEERRVLYVAMTRAKNELILTRRGRSIWAQKNLKPNELNLEPADSAYFLNKFPEGLFEEHEETGRAGLNRDPMQVDTRLPRVGIIISSDLDSGGESMPQRQKQPDVQLTLENCSEPQIVKTKLKIVRDSQMEQDTGLTLENCSAYVDESKNIFVFGELVSQKKTRLNEYREVQMLVLDTDEATMSREYTNWSSFGYRQSFEFEVDVSDFDSAPAYIKLYPSNG